MFFSSCTHSRTSVFWAHSCEWVEVWKYSIFQVIFPFISIIRIIMQALSIYDLKILDLLLWSFFFLYSCNKRYPLLMFKSLVNPDPAWSSKRILILIRYTLLRDEIIVSTAEFNHLKVIRKFFLNHNKF